MTPTARRGENETIYKDSNRLGVKSRTIEIRIATLNLDVDDDMIAVRYYFKEVVLKLAARYRR